MVRKSAKMPVSFSLAALGGDRGNNVDIVNGTGFKFWLDILMDKEIR